MFPMRFRAGDSGKCRNSRPECRTTSFFSTDIFYPLLRVSHAEEGFFFFLSLVIANSSFSHCEPFFHSLRTLLSFIANSSFSHCESFFQPSRTLLSFIAKSSFSHREPFFRRRDFYLLSIRVRPSEDGGTDSGGCEKEVPRRKTWSLVRGTVVFV